MSKVDWDVPEGTVDVRTDPMGNVRFTDGKEQWWSAGNNEWIHNVRVSSWPVVETRYATLPPPAHPLGGYQWGIEYHTDGKRPDGISDDVLVKVNSRNPDYWYEARQFCINDWSKCKVFKITDERYKPQPGTSPVPGSDWFDWDKHVAVKWPPEGTECEYWNDREWIKLIVMAVCDDEAWLTAEVDWRHSISSDFSKLMPFGHHKIMRERRLVSEIKADAPGMTDEMAMSLIKAGWGKEQ